MLARTRCMTACAINRCLPDAGDVLLPVQQSVFENNAICVIASMLCHLELRKAGRSVPTHIYRYIATPIRPLSATRVWLKYGSGECGESAKFEAYSVRTRSPRAVLLRVMLVKPLTMPRLLGANRLPLHRTGAGRRSLVPMVVCNQGSLSLWLQTKLAGTTVHHLMIKSSSDFGYQKLSDFHELILEPFAVRRAGGS
jgi:hypothetical protein